MKDPIVTITARTGGEPQLQFTNSGVPYTTVRAVWSQDQQDRDGNWQKVHETWATIEWWGTAAEQVDALRIGSGDLIRFTGALWQDQYTRKDGTPGQTIKVRCDGTPKVWPKRERDASGTGWTDGQGQGPAPAPENTAPAGGRAPGLMQGGGAGHDDPPF